MLVGIFDAILLVFCGDFSLFQQDLARSFSILVLLLGSTAEFPYAAAVFYVGLGADCGRCRNSCL